MRHVPYKSGPEAVTGVLSGDVSFIFFTVPSVLKQVEAGKLRALAITSAARSQLVPDVPTVAEAGFPDFEVLAWYALFAPRDTPAAIVARLGEEVEKIVRLPEVREKMAQLGAEPKFLNAAQLTSFVNVESPRWGQLIKEIRHAGGVGWEMRLAEYSLHPYHLRYERPVQWSDIVEDAAPFLLLRLQSDTGAVGVAEITVKPTWCGVTIRSLSAMIEEVFAPLLASTDLDNPTTVRSALDRIPENLAAKALIDNACWDLHAASRGRPLWREWGGVQRVELSWALTRQPPRLMAAEAERMIARHGFRTLKVKGGQGFDVDTAGMRAIRAAVGEGVRLYVDANGAYAPDQALDYAHAMADAGAVMLEDPCALAPDAWFRELQQASPIPLLVDFGCTSVRDAAAFIAHGARALSTKPGRFGLTNVRAMEALARRAGCGSVVGLMGESVLGTLAALQFAAALPHPILPAELTWFLAMTEQVTRFEPKIVDGTVELPEVASLAELIDWSMLRRP